MKYKTLSLWISVLFFMAGCARLTGTTSLQPTIPNLSTSTQTQLPTGVVIKTETPTAAAVTLLSPIPSALSTPTINSHPTLALPTPTTARLIENCISIVPSGTGGIVNTGSLYVTRVRGGEIRNASLEPNTLEPRLLFSEVWFLNFFVSPYTGTIAWIDDNNIMHFQQSNGNEFQFQLDETWGRFRQWLSGDRVILGQFPTAKYGGYYPADDDFYILTPDTGQIEHYHFEMPEYFATGLSANAKPHGPIYDPSFHWAIYAMRYYDSSVEGMLLWDVQNAREIWRSDNLSWSSALSGADWRQDGNEVVITSPEVGSDFPPELFSLTIDGVATQLTHLSESIPTDYMIFDTLWSPNGRYIAFVLNADLVQPLESRILYILDLESGIATNYCISPVNDLVWSPNSNQIAFTVDHRRLVILNIDSGRAQGIDDVITDVYGWTDWILP